MINKYEVRGFLSVFAVLVAALTLAMATSGTAAPNKPYSVVMTTGVQAAGGTVTAVVTNDTVTQNLGSADFTAPAGYTLDGSTTQSTRGTATVVGNLVQLRNANLTPGQSLTITIGVLASPCTASTWSVIAKQSNDFSGTPGNNLGPQINTNLVTTLCMAPCKQNVACTTDTSNRNGDANVFGAKSKLTGALFESANDNNLAPLSCENPDGSTYMSADPNSYGVLTTADRSKVVTITISKPLVTIPLSAQQVCFDAPYTFGTRPGAPLQPDGNEGFKGLLQDCGKGVVGPCHNRKQDTMVGSSVALVVDIPSGLPDDPHMR